MSRFAARVALVIYCLALFFAADFIYSTFLHQERRWPRYPHPVYDHTLLPNFDGYDYWGEVRYRLVTNSLGFRDGSTREVPLVPTARRILLIGDSFSEGTGVPFEDSFAGRLYSAGMKQANKIEFLDAGVISYSPTLYYKKIKYFLERGLRFDEVIVFSDVSDVYDEATKYFCQDDDPVYRKYCDPRELAAYKSICEPGADDNEGRCRKARAFFDDRWGAYLTSHFFVTNALRVLVKFRIQQWEGIRKKRRLAPSSETGWVFRDAGQEPEYAPLGSEGGIARSLKNMQALADLLKEKRIPITIVVYPWPVQIAVGDRESRQAALWREFCGKNCKAFIDVSPAFFSEAEVHRGDWYEQLFIPGDFHYSARGHELMFGVLAKQLLD